jgi:hypothetical protein
VRVRMGAGKRVRLPPGSSQECSTVWAILPADWAGAHLSARPPRSKSCAERQATQAHGKQTTGIAPISLDEALTANPSSVQEWWFAGHHFLKPLALVVLEAFWLSTGIISLTIGWELGFGLMRRTAFPGLVEVSVVGGALADIVVGTLVAFRRTAYRGLLLGVAVSVLYAVTGTLLLPELWRDPLGPLLKIWPILVCHLMTIAILRDR